MSQKLGTPFGKGMRWHDWHRSRVQQQTRCWCKRCSADFKRAACSAASWNRWNHLNHGATGGALETTPSWIPNHDKHIVPKTAGFSQFFWTFVCLRLSKNVLPRRSRPEWKISPGSHVGSPWFSMVLLVRWLCRFPEFRYDEAWLPPSQALHLPPMIGFLFEVLLSESSEFRTVDVNDANSTHAFSRDFEYFPGFSWHHMLEMILSKKYGLHHDESV